MKAANDQSGSVYFKLLYLISALAFILSLAIHPYPGSFVLKSIPCLTLALLAWQNRGKILSLGLLFSMAGDIFLDVDNQAFFVHGLASFLLAHLVYTWAFLKEVRWDKQRLPWAAGILTYMGLLTWLLLPNLGPLTSPVLAYIACISLMGISAAFVQRPLASVFLGAGIFILSDSVIALNQFLAPIPGANIWILLTYFVAQYKIALGMLALKTPIVFACQQEINRSPQEICDDILDLTHWPDFEGFGPVPGIEKAEFKTQTETVVGTRIKVTNRDGSTHIEEITHWDGEHLVMQMGSFSPPLKHLAEHFEEHWYFEPGKHKQTLINREFRLFAKNLLGEIILSFIAVYLKQAVAKHLSQMSDSAER